MEVFLSPTIHFGRRLIAYIPVPSVFLTIRIWVKVSFWFFLFFFECLVASRVSVSYGSLSSA